MITIYHLDNSRSERIVWLMEELGLPYEQQTFMRDRGLAPAELRAIHSLGRAPLIRDGEQVVMESGAIVEYIIARHGGGKLMPPVASPDYPRYLEWLHFAEGSAMSALLGEFMMRRAVGAGAGESPAVQMMSGRNQALMQYIDAEMAKAPYLAGQAFTAADIMMEFCFSFQERYAKSSFGSYPHITAWLGRIRARPAYVRAMAAAAPKVQF